MSGTGVKLDQLTQRLLAGQTGIEERLALLASSDQTPELSTVMSLACWPAICEFISELAAAQTPTLVYGDYDVDGSTSVFLLHRALRALGVPGNTFLPSRFRHGYGLDSAVLEQAAEQGYRALIALDCGTANLTEIARARERGLQVLVIDHHEPKAELPAAVLLNHHLEPALAPYCTAGLVYYVLAGLREEGLEIPYCGDELELAGLATLADMVPLTPANWWLAHQALIRLPETVNLGLTELIKVARLHGLSRLTGRDVGFGLGPRLNAPGRMISANLVLELLGATDQAAARSSALRLEELNQERKAVTERITRQAILRASEMQTERAGVVMADPDWHPGVLGIAAAQVAEKTGKPAIVLAAAPGSMQPEGADRLFSGSVRSGGHADVVAALGQVADLLEGFGGHADAAGLKVLASNLPELETAWSNAIAGAQQKADLLEPEQEQLAEVTLSEMSEQFETDIWRLAPFGPGFSTPRARLTGVKVSRASYMGRDRTHVNLLVTDGARQARIAGFRMSHLLPELTPEREISPLIEIGPDNYNNRLSLTLRLVTL